jgi:cardiolipin synthase
LALALDVVRWGLSLFCCVHALLNKRDPRSALGWMVLSLALPFVGPLLYLMLGVNRLRTRGRGIRRTGPMRLEPGGSAPVLPAEFRILAATGTRVTGQPPDPGHRVDALHDGEQAYPAMLDAIERAERTVFLSTYLFETNAMGRRFVDALAAAAGRGVDVRVLIDGIGVWYSRPRASRLLAARGVRVALILPPTLLDPNLHMNLRNHRKILAVDRRVGFTGGMNIGSRHMVADPANANRVQDLHFRVHGPVVDAMEHEFLEDWLLATREPIAVDAAACRAATVRDIAAEKSPAGSAWCRGLSDGPNESFERLRWVLLGVITGSSRTVRLMTPYFVPDREVIAAINTAALRGASVQIVLPERSNLPYVDWATRGMLWQVLRNGVEVYLQPAPFAHSKLLLVDECYAQVGSANIDARSLRLNFEYNLEVFDCEFAQRMSDHFDAVRGRSKRLTFEEVEARSFPVRLRDALARLASPYL